MLTTAQLLEQIKDKVKETGTAKALASDIGVSPQFVGDIIHGRRDISEAFARKLGYEKRVLWVPIGEAQS